MLSDSLIQPSKRAKNEYGQPSKIANTNFHRLVSPSILHLQIFGKNDRSMIFLSHSELSRENADLTIHSSKNHFLSENVVSMEVFDEFMEYFLLLFLHDQ